MHRMKKQSILLLLLGGLILGCWQNRVALLQEGEMEPVQIYPYRLETLPPADQWALEYGIPITSHEHLQRLLQDYLS